MSLFGRYSPYAAAGFLTGFISAELYDKHFGPNAEPMSEMERNRLINRVIKELLEEQLGMCLID